MTKGTGENSNWLYQGALDGKEYYETHKHDYKKLMHSYDYEWIKDRLRSSYPDETWD